jgi:hypothetical protein
MYNKYDELQPDYKDFEPVSLLQSIIHIPESTLKHREHIKKLYAQMKKNGTLNARGDLSDSDGCPEDVGSSETEFVMESHDSESDW